MGAIAAPARPLVFDARTYGAVPHPRARVYDVDASITSGQATLTLSSYTTASNAATTTGSRVISGTFGRNLVAPADLGRTFSVAGSGENGGALTGRIIKIVSTTSFEADVAASLTTSGKAATVGVPFTAADVDLPITVEGAGAAGANLVTTIASFTNATTVTLAVNASTTVATKSIAIGVDSAAGIRAAIAAASAAGGGTVFLAAGNYLLLSFIDTPLPSGSQTYCLRLFDNVRLAGAGMGATVLHSASYLAPTSPNIATTFWNHQARDIGVEDFTTISYGTNVLGADIDCFKCLNCSDVTVRNVETVKGLYGFQLIGCHGVVMDNCLAREQWVGTVGAGMGFSIVTLAALTQTPDLIESFDIRLTNCKALNTYNNGFRIQGYDSTHVVTNVVLTNCLAYRAAQNGTARGFYLRFTDACLANCIAKDGLAFYLDAATRVDLVNCVADNCTSASFDLVGATYCRLTSCKALGTALFQPFYCESNSLNNQFTNCYAEGATGAGRFSYVGTSGSTGNRLTNHQGNIDAAGNIPQTQPGDTVDGVYVTMTGSPESVVTATIGSRCMRRDGGAATSFYVKESGTGNTGWVAK